MPGRTLPGSRIPSVVNAIGYARDPIGYLRWFSEHAGPVCRPRFPGLPMIVSFAEPALVRELFAGDPTVFHAGEATRSVLGPTLGDNSLLTLDEAAHLRQRKLLLAPFHGDSIRRWETTIRDITAREIARWPVGRPFALQDSTRSITLDVILRAVFGVRDEGRFARARELVTTFARRAHPITLFPAARRDLGPWSPWGRFRRAREALDAFIYEEIERRRAAADLADRDDVLSLLLGATDEAGEPMTPVELRDELVTVLAAGHETTATALAWAFERLLRTPAVRERLTSSLAEGDAYLDATIKETLRIRPVITDVGRKLTRDVELGGVHVPAGAVVMASLTAINFRPDLYPEPDAFRPERFLEGAPEPYTWLPFGGGIRRCIGAAFAQFEMRVVMRTILERAVLRAESPRPERSRMRTVTAAPARGCRVVLERRFAATPGVTRPGTPVTAGVPLS